MLFDSIGDENIACVTCRESGFAGSEAIAGGQLVVLTHSCQFSIGPDSLFFPQWGILVLNFLMPFPSVGLCVHIALPTGWQRSRVSTKNWLKVSVSPWLLRLPRHTLRELLLP